MGTDEADLSPPLPPLEPARSPEPEISGNDGRDWKADMMSALGESVSFGRFLSEPLEWGKWSVFANNRYLEEAAGQSRPGSVAQKKAFFEAHYARKRKSEADADTDADGDEDVYEEGDGRDLGTGAADGGVAACWVDSSCTTDEPAREEMRAVDSDAPDLGGIVDAGPVEASEEVKAVTDCVGSSCRLDGTGERSHAQDDVRVAEARKVLQLHDGDMAPVAADAAEKQPLQESSIVNQGIRDSVKKRRLPMSPLLDKHMKSSSPPSGKKGLSWSAKRRSKLHSAKENSSPSPSSGSNKQAPTSVPQKRSTLDTLHMSMNFSRCETVNAASRSRNLESTIAARISQLESANRPVKDTHPKVNQCRPTRKGFCKGIPETATRTSQLEEKRLHPAAKRLTTLKSSHISVTRVKEKLFGSTSPPVHQRTDITKGNVSAQEITKLRKSDHLPSDATSNPHQMSKGSSKDKHMCCFSLRNLC